MRVKIDTAAEATISWGPPCLLSGLTRRSGRTRVEIVMKLATSIFNDASLLPLVPSLPLFKPIAHIHTSKINLEVPEPL